MKTQSIILALAALASAAPSPHPHAHHNVHQHVEKRQQSNTGGAKAARGLIYSPAQPLAPFSGKVGWACNWATDPSTDVDLGDFVTTYWGIDDNHKGNFEKTADKYNTMIGYNEPDIASQAWLTPSLALANWKTIDDHRARGAKVGSPSVSNSALEPIPYTGTGGGMVPQGAAWLREFFKGAKNSGYKFDALTWHWYGGDANSLDQDKDMFSKQVEELEGLAGENGIGEIWITEMQRKNGQECEFINWLQNTFLPAHPKVTRWAYNQEKGTLTNGAGLSPAGQALVGEGGC